MIEQAAHLDYVRQFESSEQASEAHRTEAEQARDYFDGNQFSEAEKAALRKRKQPITPENLIKPKVESLCGLERQSRTDPKAYPRTQAHEEEANAATDALRYVSDDQDIDLKKSRVFENMMVEGFGGVEVTVHRTRGGIDPKVVRINWDRLYFDPHSSEADFSDAAYLGYVTWMDRDAALRRWPDAKDVIMATMAKPVGGNSETFDDKPRWAYWSDSKRNRVRINTHYHLKDGTWHRCVFTLAGALEVPKPVEFTDEDGKPECPLILQSAYVDRENDRYGIVRDMIPLQDEVNKRRSKFLHMVNNAKVRVSPTVAQDKEMVRREMSRPDGVLVGEQGEVEELGNFGREAGQFQLLQDSRNTLKGNIGPNATMQGKSGQDQSGRAILALQQAGMTEMTPLLDNLRHFTLRLYRQVWNRIRQYWQEERWVRVTDDEKNVRFVGINVPKAKIAEQKIGEAVKAGEIDPQQAQMMMREAQMRPDMMQPVNVIAELDVDIIIDEVNETPTLQAEQFEALTQLASSGMLGQPIPPPIVELIIQASNLRDKQKLLETLSKMQEQSAQPSPMQELQMRDAAATVMGKEATAVKTQAQTALIAAQAENEQIKPMVEGLKAGMVGGPM